MEQKGIETVKSSDNNGAIDPLYAKQREDVAKMRASLLSCSQDLTLAKTALQNISVLRVFHQVSRIIKYLDLMDKLEDKLYESIEYTVETSDSKMPSTWIQLLAIQEKLQKNLIESHKLLQPYLTLDELDIIDIVPKDSVEGPASLISSESRNKIRNSAQQMLNELNEGGPGLE